MEYFKDFKSTMEHQNNFVEKDSLIYENKILHAEKYLRYLQQQNI
jgi:hypothetical protein